MDKESRETQRAVDRVCQIAGSQHDKLMSELDGAYQTIDEQDEQIKVLKARVAELEGLLSVAKCPNCDGSGAIQVETTRIVPGCCNRPLETGECCGNAIPEQVQDFEIEQCEWCYRKDAALTKDQ